MKLRNKLILSCAALAAVATTAFSTTFAWYTANTDVTAKGLTAATESLDDATLMISLDNYTWGSSVDLTDIFAASNKLKPVEYAPHTTNLEARAATLKKWNATTNAVGDNAVVNQDYIRFTLFFKSADTGSINVKNTVFNFRNTTENLTSKVKLSSVGNPVAGSTYTLDLLRAIVVDVDVQNGHEAATEPANAEAGFTAGQFASVTAGQTPVGSHTSYSADTLVANDRDSANSDNASLWNAHTYYNAVKNLPQGTSTDDDYKPAIATNKAASEASQTNLTGSTQFASDVIGNTGAGSLTLGEASVLAITYTIYLDGWDKFCFNAVQSQTIALDLEYQGTYVKAGQ